MLNEKRYREAARRGGGRAPISLEQAPDDARPMLEPAGGATPDQVLEQEWARAVLEDALERLASRLPPAHLACFREFHIDGGVDYATLSKRHGLPEPEIGQALHHARRAFAEAVEAVVRDTVADERECREELARLSALFARAK
jgi:DNA-directed RNA polymerase specialized sigma24 family protein